MNIYVGNLSWDATEKDLETLFGYFGDVKNAVIIKERKTGRSKGFGFVDLEDDEKALIAIEKLNNTMFMDRAIVVNEARPKSDSDSESVSDSDSD
ncbi:RNA recognition motif containing protein [Cyclonatronum proteinivorum]|uniref:RNA recognition motif containing protein n=1 Tax=Cyclonatronum proteinivorum TaxID=1457365 RepID=A0A345UQ11_9BACT|nr:RNA-binding protein [Cyclonatronum proteinivorum]AXJ02563.1 RNA recognition motif containing protein [Cyclonatronum proteinivorum]